MVSKLVVFKEPCLASIKTRASGSMPIHKHAIALAGVLWEMLYLAHKWMHAKWDDARSARLTPHSSQLSPLGRHTS